MRGLELLLEKTRRKVSKLADDFSTKISYGIEKLKLAGEYVPTVIKLGTMLALLGEAVDVAKADITYTIKKVYEEPITTKVIEKIERDSKSTRVETVGGDAYAVLVGIGKDIPKELTFNGVSLDILSGTYTFNGTITVKFTNVQDVVNARNLLTLPNEYEELFNPATVDVYPIFKVFNESPKTFTVATLERERPNEYILENITILLNTPMDIILNGTLYNNIQKIEVDAPLDLSVVIERVLPIFSTLTLATDNKKEEIPNYLYYQPQNTLSVDNITLKLYNSTGSLVYNEKLSLDNSQPSLFAQDIVRKVNEYLRNTPITYTETVSLSELNIPKTTTKIPGLSLLGVGVAYLRKKLKPKRKE